MSAPVTKTVFIWDSVGEAPIGFAVLHGDYSHLHGIYINSSTADPALHDELSDLAYDNEGNCLFDLQNKFPTDAVKNGAIVIVVGFLP